MLAAASVGAAAVDGYLRVTGLADVMTLGAGSATLVVAVLDGPVRVDHPALTQASLAAVGDAEIACATTGGDGCGHGTAVAGMLVAGRETPARGICPGVRLVVRPVFGEHRQQHAQPALLARAITEAIEAGAWVVNVSAAFTGAVPLGDTELRSVLDLAASRGVIVVAAAGNDRRVGGSPLVTHPWVIAVAACDAAGFPLADANLGASISRNGISAPAVGVVSLTEAGGYGPFGGSSAAAPQVSGAIALAWSARPRLGGAEVRAAVTATTAGARRGIAPPMLDARAIYYRVTHVPGG